MNAEDIDRIARSVLVDYRPPFTLKRIVALSRGWDIILRRRIGADIHVMVQDSSPHAVRRALVSALEIDG
jgi:hypothetical protein